MRGLNGDEGSMKLIEFETKRSSVHLNLDFEGLWYKEFSGRSTDR